MTRGVITLDKDQMLIISEAAERLRMSERQLRRLVAERRIAFHRFGRSVRFALADLDTYAASCRVEPMTEADVLRGLREVA